MFTPLDIFGVIIIIIIIIFLLICPKLNLYVGLQGNNTYTFSWFGKHLKKHSFTILVCGITCPKCVYVKKMEKLNKMAHRKQSSVFIKLKH